MMIQPTKKQASILSFIRRHSESLGYPPTIREIANEFDLASTKGVKAQLDALERKGMLRRKGRGARALEVVGAGKKNTRSVPVLGRVLPAARTSRWRRQRANSCWIAVLSQAKGAFCSTSPGRA